MTVGERIKELRLQRGLSIIEVARSLGKDRTTVYKYENGTIQDMPYSILEPLAKILGTNPSYLLSGGDPYAVYPVGKVFSLPIISTVKAGYGGLAHEEAMEERENVTEETLCGYHPSECRVMIVRGNSMYPKILPGDRVLVHIQPDVESGEVAVVIVDGDEGTIKKVVKTENGISLVPFNPEYETKMITGTELESFRIYGKVVTMMRRF